MNFRVEFVKKKSFVFPCPKLQKINQVCICSKNGIYVIFANTKQMF